MTVRYQKGAANLGQKAFSANSRHIPIAEALGSEIVPLTKDAKSINSSIWWPAANLG